jgi:hypothetical protein
MLATCSSAERAPDGSCHSVYEPGGAVQRLDPIQLEAHRLTLLTSFYVEIVECLDVLGQKADWGEHDAACAGLLTRLQDVSERRPQPFSATRALTLVCDPGVPAQARRNLARARLELQLVGVTMPDRPQG